MVKARDNKKDQHKDRPGMHRVSRRPTQFQYICHRGNVFLVRRRAKDSDINRMFTSLREAKDFLSSSGFDLIKDFLVENRLTSRKHNRKFKVPRWVLSERLRIFCISVAKVRSMVMEHGGYDPDFRNIDQSPFHMNEAGSKEGRRHTDADTSPESVAVLARRHAAPFGS